MDIVVERLQEINEIDEIVISTTNNLSDEPFEGYCQEKGIRIFRFDGDINDVVGRHYYAAKASVGDYMVVLSGDCPLADTDHIRKGLYMLAEGYDAVRAENWPEYMIEGIEIMNRKAFDVLNKESRLPHEREHFSCIVENKLLDIKLGYNSLEEIFRGRHYRISVDNLADLRFMNVLYSELTSHGEKFDIKNALRLLKEKPELKNINAHIAPKKLNDKSFRILIKTEASESKGMGHIRRMTALGAYLNENRNNGIRFAVNLDDAATRFLEDRGYSYDYCIAETEEDIISAIKEYNAEILIVDIQKFDSKTPYDFERIKAVTCVKKIVVIDKYFDCHAVNLFILQGMQRNSVLKQIEGKGNILHGLEAVIVDDRIRNCKKVEGGTNIVISFGGSDIHNLTTKIVKAINGMDLGREYQFNIVLGPYFKFIDELKNELKLFKYPYEIIINPKNIAEIFSRSILGIIYYGVTFYEFKYLRIPTIDVIPGEQYLEEFEELERTGIGHSVGNYDKVDEIKLCHYLKNIDSLKNEKQYIIGDLELISTRIME